MRNKFPKSEKLCSRKKIEKMIESKDFYYIFPFKFFWMIDTLETDVAAQSAFSAPKRKFKHAVDRNLLKRRMREAFRLNKQELYNQLNQKDKQIALFVIYTHHKILKFSQIESSMQSVITKISDSLE